MAEVTKEVTEAPSTLSPLYLLARIRATFLMHCFGQGIQFPSPYSTEEGGRTEERSGAGIWNGEKGREGGRQEHPKVEI